MSAATHGTRRYHQHCIPSVRGPDRASAGRNQGWRGTCAPVPICITTCRHPAAARKPRNASESTQRVRSSNLVDPTVMNTEWNGARDISSSKHRRPSRERTPCTHPESENTHTHTHALREVLVARTSRQRQRATATRATKGQRRVVVDKANARHHRGDIVDWKSVHYKGHDDRTGDRRRCA